MIVLDVETTGLEPKVHSIVSIGAVDTNKIINELPNPLFYGECMMWPMAKIQEEIRKGEKVYPALEINGFTESQVRYTNDEVHDNLIHRWKKWSDDSPNRTLCGENISFDINFVKEAFQRAGYNDEVIRKRIGIRGVDIHSISYESHKATNTTVPMKHERSALSLDETLLYVGLPKEAKPHNGLIGAMLEAEALWRIRYGNSLFSGLELKKLLPHEFPDDRYDCIPNFSNHPVPKYLKEKHR